MFPCGHRSAYAPSTTAVTAILPALAYRLGTPTSCEAFPPYQAGRLSQHPRRRASSGACGRGSVFSPTLTVACSLTLVNGDCYKRFLHEESKLLSSSPYRSISLHFSQRTG